MVSRRRSVALLVCLVLAGLLVRVLLKVEQPVRDSGRSPAEVPAQPEARSTEPLRTAVHPAHSDDVPNERESLPASPAQLPAPPRAPEPDMSKVLVSVLDARGRPAAGVPVGVWTFFVERDSDEGQGGSSNSARARSMSLGDGVTDATGSVELRYVAPSPDELAEVRTRIAPLLELDELPAFDSKLGELPPAAVVLRLPPAGSIRVQVEPAELATTARASVEAIFAGRLLRRSAAVIEGEAHFPFVELGHEIELRLSTAAMENRPARMVVHGPATPDEIVAVKLVLEPWPMLRFRVCDETGRPLPNASFSVRIHHGRLSPQPGNAKTDANGETEFVVYGDARNEDARELLIWSLSPPRLAHLWLPQFLEAPTELGNITLQRVAPGSVPPP